jgi:choline dehydrogenase
MDGVRISMAIAYLDPARHRLNLTIRPNAPCRRIIFQGTKAVGVEVESGDEVFVVEGEEILLTSGAMKSPQILMLSGVGPADHLEEFNIPVVKDLPGVGQNLRDHPLATVVYKAKGEAPGVDVPLIQVCTRYTSEGSHLKSDMIISPTLMTSEHRPTQIDLDDGDNYLGLSAGVQLAVGSGELRLKSADPNDPPYLDYNYLQEEFDRDRLRKGIRKVVELENHPAIRDLIEERITPTDEELASDEALDIWLLKYTGTSHHISCTCKMGPANDRMAVVDQHGKIHGLQGIRVVDASIMPDCIRANTNATTIMIAEKIADYVIQGI